MRLFHALARGYEAPLWIHYGAYVLVALIVWTVLLVAGIPGSVGLAVGVATGIAAEILANAAWRRHERRKAPLPPSSASALEPDRPATS
jgi:Flp pilus assembly protein TadB